ncbi:MAG TPA: beta-L-arabinofuranosidase domain-containing protein, partial [Longimicrobiales bacterium]|nr:beta-L-arabinofuranosidase domain-containing protein [Longimicrobiales bacterium]
WMDGLIPLALCLDDPRLKTKADARVEQIVAGQRADGRYGPWGVGAGEGRYDVWAVLLVNKVLAQYHDATGDERAFRAVEASLKALQASLEATPLFGWGRYRWFEGLVPVFHVWERTGEPWLLELARTLREQGTDYPAIYAGEDITAPTPRRGLWTWDKHVVNTGMATKAAALAWRLDRRDEDRAFPARMLAILDRYHGQANGMFSGDECLAGRNPVQGTELCSVVELMYSLEVLSSVFGDPAFGDRLERVAYNALPATFSPDMWAHQYDQQVNQIQCTVNPDHMWTSNGPESNIYGLEPNYGCCTSNMHQGWPKLVSHLWMETPDGGLAAVAWAPSEASFHPGEVPVSVRLDTDYPFREGLGLSVVPERPVTFPLLLRVPAWAEGATVQVAGEAPSSMTPGTFHRLEREWREPTELRVRFPMRTRVTRRYHGALAVERGPLVYSLGPEEAWTRIHVGEPHRELPHGDFEVRPTTPWNYGLLLDPEAPGDGIALEEVEVGERPFSPGGAGVRLRVEGRRLPDWETAHGWAGEIGPGLHASREPLEELALIPYGCT